MITKRILSIVLLIALCFVAQADAPDAESYYREENYLDLDGHLVTPFRYASADYEVAQMERLNDHLKARGIPLLYVNAPTKYVDDALIEARFGIESYVNRNADRFIRRLREHTDIPVLDLRDNLRAEGLDILSLFFRTDHHWTPATGLWATKHIARFMNDCGAASIDTALFDSDNYTTVRYTDAWIGEEGRKLADVPRDDFTCIEPSPDLRVSVTQLGTGSVLNGGSELLLNKAVYNSADGRSWYYSYMPLGLDFAKLTNLSGGEGRILLLGDSYAYTVVPFLIEGVHEITTVIMRRYTDDLMQLIDAGDYDCVVVFYVEFMIGAQTDPGNDNYGMFSFDRELERTWK